ncbi:MAG TPA: cellulose binding domain-containing protein, partial [Saprospiraceae bacterium]|nr:cellulose binding domain-containing protein [Saprospiraceae bacterium]
SGPTNFCVGDSVSLSAPAGFESYLWSNGSTSPSIQVTQSGSFTVVVTNSNGCSSATSDVVNVTVNGLAEKPVITTNGPTNFCMGGSVSLSAPAGFVSYLWSNGATSPSIQVSESGSFSVAVTNNIGCVSATSDVVNVTVNALAEKPVITASGPLSFSQGGRVTLYAPAGFASYLWNNDAITSSITTNTSGVFTVVVQNNSGCSSPISNPVTVDVQVVAASLSVLYKDGDNNKLNNNNIRPYLQVNNEGASAVAYKDLSIRYWLTVEDFSPMTNLYIDWAQLGTGKVKMKYVKLAEPRKGAYGYIEYTFDTSAGNLLAMGNSGPIQSRAGKSDWTNFNEANDHSYASSGNYAKNNKITLYKSGMLVWGTEPEVDQPVQSLKSYTSQNSFGTTTNALQNYIKLNNEGNTPLSYKDIKMRYWFTAEGNTPLNYSLDYAELGNNLVQGKIVTLTSPLVNADAYLEISFTAPDSLYPASSTGKIQGRITKSDWSDFNQLNDHSFKTGTLMTENVHVTIYHKNTLVYGVEPESPILNMRSTVPSDLMSFSDLNVKSPFNVTVLNNPVINDEVEFIVRGADGKNVKVLAIDASGKEVGALSIGRADSSEKRHISLGHATNGVFYLKVIANQEMKTIPILKVN